MEFEINNSPELTMAEITKKLFNCKLLSDVQFCVAGRTIYGHSLELMKRSTVFQNQLEKTLDANKLIPINDVPYDSAYQFFRFIYTDDCHVNNTNVIGMLKLAKRYKVNKLENHLLESIVGMQTRLIFYEYCVMENDQRHIRRCQETITYNLGECLRLNEFLTIHPIVLETILKFERSNVSEVELFDALARWITQHSHDNQIEISQQKAVYEKYLRMVRFPVMSADDVIKCITKHPHLFSDNDYITIFKTLASDPGAHPVLWHNEPRRPYSFPYAFKIYPDDENFETKFTVSHEMVLNCLRFGRDYNKANFDIIFSQTNHKITKQLKLGYKSSPNWNSITLNLGESIRLKPDLVYSIQFKYNTMEKSVSVLSRDGAVYTNLPPNLIQFETININMFEMYFTLVNK